MRALNGVLELFLVWGLVAGAHQSCWGELMEGRRHTRHWEEERQELCVRKRKARFELHQGKQMVEIRGKLADVNDDKAAHSLSTKNVCFSAFAGVRKQWRDICWQWFGKSWSSLRGEQDDYFSSLTSPFSVTPWS